jgi:hypothetical protein
MRTITGLVLLVPLALGMPPPAHADRWREGACTRTSETMALACRAEIRDDYYVETAKCLNESEFLERIECRMDVGSEYREARELCGEQLEARLDVCEAIGEAPYDPSFEPEDFETSLDYLSRPNPYFPMKVGNEWTYGGDEDIHVEVLDQTKLIDDIVCFVVRDVVTVDGDVAEDTNDWLAVSKVDGSIWYCGEEVKDYEYFDGDAPRLPELVDIGGSFKVERDGARAGVFFPGYPNLGDIYRQEFLPGEAEDIGEVVSISYGFGADPELDEMVPEDLVDLLCDFDCVVIAESNPLEPDVFELKYFARDIGFFLGINPEDEELVQLTDCSFNIVCALLPGP